MNLINDEAGATLVEYGLIVGLIAVVCFVAIGTLGKKVNTEYTNIGNDF